MSVQKLLEVKNYDSNNVLRRCVTVWLHCINVDIIKDFCPCLGPSFHFFVFDFLCLLIS